MAAFFILIAVFMDGADGKIARRLDACSEIGKELDSLCDLVSFGVAPALLIYSQLLSFYPVIGLIVAMVFIMCGTYRLARFNVLNISDHFVGLPITFAGLATALISIALSHHLIPSFLVLLLMFALAGLMVSRVMIPKI